MHQRLVKYRNDHGHTNVPFSFNDRDYQPHLGKCVAMQRYQKNRNDPPYSEIRADKLNSIGFVWILNAEARSQLSIKERDRKYEKAWESTFQRLVKYRNDHGLQTYQSPSMMGDVKPQLGQWVAMQRYLRKKNDPPYSKIRAEKLDSVGFVWILNAEALSQLSIKEGDTKHEKAWESTFQRLVKFCNEHGHTNVPSSFNDGDEKPQLGQWVIKQRFQKKRNDPPYSKIRAVKLDSIGFVWTFETIDCSQQHNDESS